MSGHVAQTTTASKTNNTTTTVRFWLLFLCLLPSWSNSILLPGGEQCQLPRRELLKRLPFVLPSSITTATAASTFLTSPDTARAIESSGQQPIDIGGDTDVRKRPPHLALEYFDSTIETATDAGRSFFPTLTPPFRNRATFRYNVGRNAWALEQLLTFANVTATIRTHVVKLESTGGLWVHSPQWPTGEFCQLLNDLDAPVEHIVLPCNALEHKAPMKAFVERYPKASVWISPGQYGPFGSCGQTMDQTINMGFRVDGILGDDNQPPPPWADEFDMAILYLDLPKNAGPVSEVAFHHCPSRTLVSTDAVVFIPNERDARLDLFKTYFDDDTVEKDSTFWPRTVLQAVFLPLRVDAGNRYPGFDVLQDRLVRAPIPRGFVDARSPEQVAEWVSIIAKWDFDRIVTSHFASPVVASPQDFVNAFAYLYPNGDRSRLPQISCQDWELLEGINDVISKYNLGESTVFDYTRGCVRED